MPAWPINLPSPTPTGYSISPVDPTIRTEMEGGATRTRRRTFARNDKVSVKWEMTDAQLSIFRAWFDSNTGASGGTAWFNVNLGVGNGGISAVEAKFSKVWSANSAGPLIWDVTAELEIR